MKRGVGKGGVNSELEHTLNYAADIVAQNLA